MIKKLSIRNYTLIDELNIEFNSGFSVITGETGAGKSIILGALSLILGQRADLKSLKRTDEKSVIEGLFDISSYHLQSFFEENELDYDAKECILRREILEIIRRTAYRYTFSASESFVGRFSFSVTCRRYDGRKF